MQVGDKVFNMEYFISTTVNHEGASVTLNFIGDKSVTISREEWKRLLTETHPRIFKAEPFDIRSLNSR